MKKGIKWMSKYCRQCGTGLEDSVKFCDKCGN